MSDRLLRKDEIITANGVTSPIVFPGGMGNVQAAGTFGGGTLKLQYSVDNGVTYVDGDVDSELTADGAYNFTLPSCLVRYDFSGGGSINVAVKTRKVPRDR